MNTCLSFFFNAPLPCRWIGTDVLSTDTVSRANLLASLQLPQRLMKAFFWDPTSETAYKCYSIAHSSWVNLATAPLPLPRYYTSQKLIIAYFQRTSCSFSYSCLSSVLSPAPIPFDRSDNNPLSISLLSYIPSILLLFTPPFYFLLNEPIHNTINTSIETLLDD